MAKNPGIDKVRRERVRREWRGLGDQYAAAFRGAFYGSGNKQRACMMLLVLDLARTINIDVAKAFKCTEDEVIDVQRWFLDGGLRSPMSNVIDLT